MLNSVKIFSSMKKLWLNLFLNTLYFDENSELLHVIITSIISIYLFWNEETKIYSAQMNNSGYTVLSSSSGIQTPACLVLTLSS